jgi:hypothetical protein
MVGDSFDARPEEHNILFVAASTVRKAELFIESCEHCNPNAAEIPFDYVLDEVTGSDPSVTDYLLETPAMCPNCYREINEKTLVEPA